MIILPGPACLEVAWITNGLMFNIPCRQRPRCSPLPSLAQGRRFIQKELRISTFTRGLRLSRWEAP